MQFQLKGTVEAIRLRTRTQIATPRGPQVGRAGDYHVKLPGGDFPIPGAVFEAITVQPEPEPAPEPETTVKTENVPVDANRGAIKLADAHGIDLSQVEGTGKNGRITKPDVQAFIDKIQSGEDTTTDEG